MKNTKLRFFPPLLMLVAGSITSIMTYYFQYELKTALLVLLSVLLIFYIIGLFFINVINLFDKKIEEEQAREELAEGEFANEERVLEDALQEDEFSEDMTGDE